MGVAPAADVELRCEAPAVSDELFVLRSVEPETEHVFQVYGLLADTDYTCTATAHRAEPVSTELRTDPLGAEPPTFTASGDRAAGSTVFNLWRARFIPETQFIYLVDADGRLRWTLDQRGHSAGIEVTGAAPDMFVGGSTLPPMLISLGKEVHHQAPQVPTGRYYHHDALLLDNGDTLTLRETPNTDGTLVWVGFLLERRTPPDPDPTWSFDSQQAFEAGTLPAGRSSGQDRYHANALAYVEEAGGPAVYVSLHKLDQVVRIDVGTGQITWALGIDGDFALVDPSGTPLGPSDWFYGQHGLDVVGSRVYLHDNGGQRPDGTERSRAVAIDVDAGAGTATLAWAWEEAGWFGHIWGDVDPLPNGNVLVLQGHNRDRGTTVDPDVPLRFTEVDPATGDVVHRITVEDGPFASYRVARLDTCAFFAHAGYCPELLD